MFIDYFRPKSLKEALNLLRMPNKIPLAGGTFLATNKSSTNDLVDLQDLGLNTLIKRKQGIEIGAMVRLQQLLDSQFFPESFQTAIKLETSINIRNSASVGGLLVKCDGRSSIVTSLLAMDSTVFLEPNHESVPLNDFLNLRYRNYQNRLITSIKLQPIIYFSFQYVARTKFDQPIISAALSIFANGKTWLVLGGFGDRPHLVSNGNILVDLPLDARNAFCNAEDEWASAEYRSAIAEILTNRCLIHFSVIPEKQ